MRRNGRREKMEKMRERFLVAAHPAPGYLLSSLVYNKEDVMKTASESFQS
jgi:hypothetical protein